MAVMVSDEAHRDLWREEIAPNLKPGAAVISRMVSRCVSDW